MRQSGLASSSDGVPVAGSPSSGQHDDVRGGSVETGDERNSSQVGDTQAAGRRRGRRPRQRCKCLADGCSVGLCPEDPEKLRRAQLCADHFKAEVVTVEGSASRYCHQCARVHPLARFEGLKRSCKARTERRKARLQANRCPRIHSKISAISDPPGNSEDVGGGSCSGSAHVQQVPAECQRLNSEYRTPAVAEPTNSWRPAISSVVSPHAQLPAAASRSPLRHSSNTQQPNTHTVTASTRLGVTNDETVYGILAASGKIGTLSASGASAARTSPSSSSATKTPPAPVMLKPPLRIVSKNRPDINEGSTSSPQFCRTITQPIEIHQPGWEAHRWKHDVGSPNVARVHHRQAFSAPTAPAILDDGKAPHDSFAPSRHTAPAADELFATAVDNLATPTRNSCPPTFVSNVNNACTSLSSMMLAGDIMLHDGDERPSSVVAQQQDWSPGDLRFIMEAQMHIHEQSRPAS